MRRAWLVALLLAVPACSGGGGAAPIDAEPAEGFIVGPAPRLDVAGLAGPVEVAEPKCVARYEVTAGGLGAGGAPTFLLTMHLTTAPADEAALGTALGEAACGEERAGITDEVIARLGRVGRDSLDVSYRGSDGRRWLVG